MKFTSAAIAFLLHCSVFSFPDHEGKASHHHKTEGIDKGNGNKNPIIKFTPSGEKSVTHALSAYSGKFHANLSPTTAEVHAALITTRDDFDVPGRSDRYGRELFQAHRSINGLSSGTVTTFAGARSAAASTGVAAEMYTTPITNIELGEGDAIHYYIDLTANQGVSCSTEGDGDANLLMNIGSIADSSLLTSNDCISLDFGSNEECFVAVSEPARVYATVFTTDDFASGLTFKCTVRSSPQMYTVPVTNMTLSMGDVIYYYMDLTAREGLYCSIDGPNGNANLYMNIGSMSDLSAYKSCLSFGSKGGCFAAVSEPKRVYAAVSAYSEFSGLTFQCTVNSAEMYTTPITNMTLGINEVKNYYMDVGAGEGVFCSIDWPGSLDRYTNLIMKIGSVAIPYSDENDCEGEISVYSSDGSNEECFVAVSEPARVYVAVYEVHGFSVFGGLTLQCTVKSPELYTAPVTMIIGDALDYYMDLTADQGVYCSADGSNVGDDDNVGSDVYFFMNTGPTNELSMYNSCFRRGSKEGCFAFVSEPRRVNAAVYVYSASNNLTFQCTVSSAEMYTAPITNMTLSMDEVKHYYIDLNATNQVVYCSIHPQRYSAELHMNIGSMAHPSINNNCAGEARDGLDKGYIGCSVAVSEPTRVYVAINSADYHHAIFDLTFQCTVRSPEMYTTPIINMALTTYDSKHYYIDLTANQTVHCSTGFSDSNGITMKIGSIALPFKLNSNNDCWSDDIERYEEGCSVAVPEPARVYVAVYANIAFIDLAFKCTVSFPEMYMAPITTMTLSMGEAKNYYMDIGASEGVYCSIDSPYFDSPYYLRLFMKVGSIAIPNSDENDCKSRGGVGEGYIGCSVAVSEPTRVYVAIRAYSAFSGLTFQCTVRSPEMYTAPITNMSLSVKDVKQYYMDIGAGEGVSCSTDGQYSDCDADLYSCDADLFMKVGSIAIPNSLENDCESISSYSAEECSIVAVLEPIRVYITVYAYSTFGSRSFQCTSRPPEMYIAPITNMTLSTGVVIHYYIDLTTEQGVHCSTDGPDGNAELYMKVGSIAIPYSDENDCNGRSLYSIEECFVAVPEPTRVYVAVYAKIAFSDLTFKCTVKFPEMYTTPVTLSIGKAMYYYMDLTADQGVYCSIDGSNGDAEFFMNISPTSDLSLYNSCEFLESNDGCFVFASKPRRVYATVYVPSASNNLTFQCTVNSAEMYTAPITNMTLSMDEVKHYYIDINATNRGVHCSTNGQYGDGNAVLYMNIGSIPSINNNYCTSENAGPREGCSYYDYSRELARVYVAVHANSAFSGLTFQCILISPELYTTPIINMALTVNDAKHYYIDLTETDQGVYCSTDSPIGDGNAELYMNIGLIALPFSLNSNTCESLSSGSEEECSVAVSGPVRVYVAVYANTAFIGLTFQCTVRSPANYTVPITNMTLKMDEVMHYYIDLNAGEGLYCSTEGFDISGEADLFMKIGSIAIPNSFDNDCESRLAGSKEECFVAPVSEPTRVYVAVHAYSAFSGLTFQCTVRSPEMYTAPITNMTLSTGDVSHYYFDLTAEQGVYCATNGLDGDADVFMKIGSVAIPNFSGENDCNGGYTGSDEVCFIGVSEPTRVYAAVHAYSAFRGLTFKCTVRSSELYTAPVTMSIGDAFYYYMDLTAEQGVYCSADGSNSNKDDDNVGDDDNFGSMADLYFFMNPHSTFRPSTVWNSCSGLGSKEGCFAFVWEPRRVYAAVYVYSASNNLTFQCTVSSAEMYTAPITNMTLSMDEVKHYYIDISATNQGVYCSTDGPDGDADLYMNIGRLAHPSINFNYCTSENTGSGEGCFVHESKPTRVYVAVHAYSAFSGLTFQCAVRSPEMYTTPITNMALGIKDVKQYYMDIDANNFVYCSTNSLDMSGDVNLVMNVGSVAIPNSYSWNTCESISNGSDEECFIGVSESARVYAAIFTRNNYASGLTFQCNVRSPELYSVPNINMTLSISDVKSYYVDLTADQGVICSIDGPVDDADLIMKVGSIANPYDIGENDCKGLECSIHSWEAARVYVTVYAYSAFSDLTFQCTVRSPEMYKYIPITSMTLEMGNGIHYYFDLIAEQSVYCSTDGLDGDADVFMKIGSIAIPYSPENDCNSVNSGPEEGCFATVSEPTRVYVTVYAFYAFSGLTFKCTFDPESRPDCSEARPSKDLLWPPNHKFEAITILGVIDRDDDTVAITIDSIYSDEETATADGAGGGTKHLDAYGIGTSIASVRAERSAVGNGRVYHIDFTASNSKGSTCNGTVKVGVPLVVNKTPVDGGRLHNATVFN